MRIDDLIYEHYGLENPSKASLNENKSSAKKLNEEAKKKRASSALGNLENKMEI